MPILVNRFFDVLWLPLSYTPAYVDILIISVLSALLFLVIFKKTSNQKMIAYYKNRIIAYILEIRLYKDKPAVTLKNIGRIVGCNVLYLRYFVVPLAIIIIPVLIISVQLFNRLGHLPLKVDASFIICAQLDKDVVLDIKGSMENVRCETSSGIALETPPLRIISEGSTYWRGRVISPDGKDQFIKVWVDGFGPAVQKKVLTSNDKKGMSTAKTKYKWSGLLVDNAGGFIPMEAPFSALRLGYKPGTYPFLIWRIDPVLLYFIFTLIAGFLLKPIVKVAL